MAENKKFTKLINSDGTKQAVALDKVSFDEQTKKLTLYSSVDNSIKEETTIPASEVDTTLSQSGLAADAEVTGNAVKDVVKVGGTASSFTGIIVGTQEEEIELVEQKDFDAEIAKLNAKVGTPLVANTASAMVNTTKIYVYTGNESGYVNGNWYFYNGTNWESGGVYNAVAVQTDKTLTQENKAADAKKTGDELDALKSTLSDFKENQPNLFYRTGKNLVDRSWFTDGKRIGSDGNISNSATACATEDYIDISDITDGYIGAYYTNSANGTPLRAFAYMAFYDANKTKLQYYHGDTSATMTNAIVAIPENAKYMRVTFGVPTTSKYGFMVISGSQDMTLINYEAYTRTITVVPADLNDQLDRANETLNIVDNISGVTFSHTDFAVKTITRLNDSYTFNQNDFTIVKDELWLAKVSDVYYENGTMIFRYKVIDGVITLVGTIDCDFGHLNVIDYSEKNDCLIFGNGANDTETVGNYFVVVPNPLSLGSTALIADVGIKYDVDIGFKVNAVWGSDNFGENNIVILMSNNLQKITKVMLNRDANGEFDGTYITLETQDNLETFGIQGADCWGDNLYVGGQVESNTFYAIKVISLSDYTSKIIKFKKYKSDGTAYKGTVQGVYVGQFGAWIFCNSDAPQTGVCCFLTQYRL